MIRADGIPISLKEKIVKTILVPAWPDGINSIIGMLHSGEVDLFVQVGKGFGVFGVSETTSPVDGTKTRELWVYAATGIQLFTLEVMDELKQLARQYDCQIIGCRTVKKIVAELLSRKGFTIVPKENHFDCEMAV